MSTLLKTVALLVISITLTECDPISEDGCEKDLADRRAHEVFRSLKITRALHDGFVRHREVGGRRIGEKGTGEPVSADEASIVGEGGETGQRAKREKAPYHGGSSGGHGGSFNSGSSKPDYNPPNNGGWSIGGHGSSFYPGSSKPDYHPSSRPDSHPHGGHHGR
ncbi:unnamed protein product [Anisakis simplex]|uniref:Secreted protein n=1 Tax=Anisakis simplex TaxID=6269 RepID=A0A0M3JW01_ANISI|nr:unnamed protein product [Anisakis simplex]